MVRNTPLLIKLVRLTTSGLRVGLKRGLKYKQYNYCDDNMKTKRTSREDVESPDHATVEAIELESITESRLSCHSIRDLRSTQLHEVTDLATGCVDVRGDPKTAYQMAILICSILLIITLLQIPTILYYVNSPSIPDISSFSGDFDVDLDTCSVSGLIYA